MGRYDLRIVFDRPERTYVPGERITGRIEVTVHEDCECKGLWVYCEWKASSGGIGDAGNAGQQKLFAGTWRAGQHAAYPFEFVAPPGPLTYDGQMFAIRWSISASALVGLINPAVEERFRLVAGKPPEEAQLDQGRPAPQPYRQAAKVEEGSSGRGLKAVLSVAALVVGVPALILGLLEVLPWFVPIRVPFPLPRITPLGAPPFAALVVGAILTSLGWRGVKRSLRPAVAEAKLGPLELELSSAVARPGDTITCTVLFQPRTNIDLAEAAAKLVATEHVVVRGQGDDPDRHDHQVVSESHATLSPARTLTPGENVLLQANLSLPTEAPYSFVGSYNKLLWTVHLELKLRGWPDWVSDLPFTVRP